MAEPEFILTFHGIGKPPPDTSDAESAFWIDAQLYRAVLELVLKLKQRRNLSLTFDDGNESDHAIGLPALKEAGLSASFFVLAGKIGQPPFLSAAQIKEMASRGMTIGLHGMDHVDWTLADDAVLKRETREARSAIELLIGKPVTDTAIPFGRYNRKVLSRLKREGFRNIYTSDGGIRYASGRVKSRYSVRRTSTVAGLERIIDGAFGRLRRAEAELRYQLKSMR